MTRLVVQTVAIVGFTFLAGFPCARDLRGAAASDKAKDEDCRKYVQQFYEWYANAGFDSSGVSDSLDDVLDKKLLSNELADQLDDVLDAEDRHDEVWLDSDPILNRKHQWDSYVAGPVTRKGEHYLVEVYGISDGKKFSKPDVVAELVFQIGRWTFVNFHYPNHAATPARENLLGVLRGIRKSHPVKPHAPRSGEPEASDDDPDRA